MSGEFMYRHHEELGLKVYDADNETFPMPFYVDAMRQTQRRINNVSGNTINDKWTEANGVYSFWGVDWDYKVSDRTFKTSWMVQVGKRKTHEHPRNKEKSLAAWAEEDAEKQAARRNRRIWEVQTDDKHSLLQGDSWCSSETGQRHCSRTAVHREGWQPRKTSGWCNFNWRQNEKRSDSENEGACWKLSLWLGAQASFCSWRFENNRSQCRGRQCMGEIREFQRGMGSKLEQSQMSSVKRRRKTGHFPNSMGSCHLKNAELAKHLHTYKVRVVLGEDNVEDEEWCRAVLTEQGASASQMAATTFLDTISKLLGLMGESSDAISTYTRKDERNSQNVTLAEGWMSWNWVIIPPRQSPKRWDNIDNTVVLL